MVYASNPRLMNRVLDAVVHLCEGKGSTARDVLDFLRQTSKGPPRNLTMQVHRALKHAVNAGLLRHRSGRYKAVFTLNPAPIKQSVKENNEQRSADGTNISDIQQTSSRSQSNDEEENREKRRRPRGEKRRRRSDSQKRRKRRSRSRKRDEPKHIGEIRKLKYKEKGESVRSPRHKISNSRLEADIGNTSGSPNRKRTKTKRRDPSNYSDLSDCSEYEDRKAKARRRNSMCPESSHDGFGKQYRRSISRHRSPQKQQSQQLNMKYSNDDNETSKLNANEEGNDEADQEGGKEEEEPNNSGSGSTL
ncbi:uncharacterized protein LOC117162160 [Bombus vancouverensis nearcticus]|uniref:Luc7-like protein 3 n=1 Tax=Bombus bifarius TaxID=103933 RepID=A0A6P8N4E9_9HYME|nr:luc7-like protein 3 [Bombus vancouverensis nearcticus]XP_033315404.1 luc7-like protein 3 [Bombus bifarius]